MLRFMVRRPASAEVCPRCHRPSGGDTARSVHVAVARFCIAGFALENRLALAVSGSGVHTGLRHGAPRTADHRPHISGNGFHAATEL